MTVHVRFCSLLDCFRVASHGPTARHDFLHGSSQVIFNGFSIKIFVNDYIELKLRLVMRKIAFRGASDSLWDTKIMATCW